MRKLIDCHVHTGFCNHAKGEPRAYVEAARDAGVAAMVFTEHAPLPDAFDPDRHLSICDADLETYCTVVRSLAEEHAGTGVEIGVGLEVDWLSDDPGYAAASIARGRSAGAEIFLGSVHFLGTWAFDDPNDLSGWDARRVDDVWAEYIAIWCEAAASGLFDVMAHPDLPKKFGHRPAIHPLEAYGAMAKAALAGDAAIEVSTAGLRKPVAELYPGYELLSVFSAAGVPATVGSDAHAPAEVGIDMATAYDALLRAGYARVAIPQPDHERRYLEL